MLRNALQAAIYYILLFAIPFAHAESIYDNEFSVLIRDHSTTHAQHLINQAIDSALNRMDVSYVENGTIRSEGFFEKLGKIAKKWNPNAEVQVSSGGIR